MLVPRLIPILLVNQGSLVKTRQFKDFKYVGDPCNTARIFNELEVDELILLDIGTARCNTDINWKLLEDLAEECFMPLSYGGAIKSIDEAARLFEIGYEKISVNSSCLDDPSFVNVLAGEFGSQAIVASIDVDSHSKDVVYVRHPRTRKSSGRKPLEWVREIVDRGAGEILLTDVRREGTWGGMNHSLIAEVTAAVQVPVIAHGGAASLLDVQDAIQLGGATSVAVGNMVVFQKQDCGVLVHYPARAELDEVVGG